MLTLPIVLIVPARPDERGRRAAARAAAALAELADARVADRAELPGLLPTAEHVVVLDPGRWRALVSRHPVLDAPARAADRLALLRRLQAWPTRVRWVGRPDQWEDVRAVLLARAAATTPVRS